MLAQEETIDHVQNPEGKGDQEDGHEDKYVAYDLHLLVLGEVVSVPL